MCAVLWPVVMEQSSALTVGCWVSSNLLGCAASASASVCNCFFCWSLKRNLSEPSTRKASTVCGRFSFLCKPDLWSSCAGCCFYSFEQGLLVPQAKHLPHKCQQVAKSLNLSRWCCHMLPYWLFGRKLLWGIPFVPCHKAPSIQIWRQCTQTRPSSSRRRCSNGVRPSY